MSIKMPWGKHQGTTVENLPTDYIEWLVDEMDKSGSHKRNPKLFKALDDELFYREKPHERPSSKTNSKPSASGGASPLSPEARKLLPQFVKSGYRAMSLKVHPDKGGSDAQMIALQELKQFLDSL